MFAVGLQGVGNTGGSSTHRCSPCSLAAWVGWELLSKRHFWGGAGGKRNLIIFSVLLPIHLLFHMALAYAATCLPCNLEVEVPFGEMLNSLHSLPCALGSQALSHGPLSNDTGEHFQQLTARDYILWNSQASFKQKKNWDFLWGFFFFFNLLKNLSFPNTGVRTADLKTQIMFCSPCKQLAEFMQAWIPWPIWGLPFCP